MAVMDGSGGGQSRAGNGEAKLCVEAMNRVRELYSACWSRGVGLALWFIFVERVLGPKFELQGGGYPQM